MITLSVDNYNSLSQDFYDKTISNLSFRQLTCTCAHSGCLIRHGHYYRTIKSGGGTIPIRICRVKCCHCSKTHALLLSAFIPYSQICLQEQVDIISSFEQGHLSAAVMDRTPAIDENNLHYVIRQYLKYWRQRLLSVRLSLDSPLLSVHCFSHFSRQFMQNKNTPNLLFAAPT